MAPIVARRRLAPAQKSIIALATSNDSCKPFFVCLNTFARLFVLFTMQKIATFSLICSITPTNDWGAVIDHALNSCITNKPSAQSLGIDSLLNVGCRKVS